MIFYFAPVPLLVCAAVIAGAWYLSGMIHTAALLPVKDMTFAKMAEAWKLRGKLPDGSRVQEIRIPAPGGTLPAWYLPGLGTTWLVSLHGKGGNRHENALGLPALAARLNMPALAISYRNDADAYADPDGLYTYGRTEWIDLSAAMFYARTKFGAEKFILAGNSYGGGIVASFLRRSRQADRVLGVIFNAPMLDFRQCVRQVGRTLKGGKLIIPVIMLAERITSRRFGVDWDAVNYLSDTSWLKVPALVMHGSRDQVVPLSTSQELKRQHPDLVTLEVSAVGHGEAWGRSIRKFLTSFAPKEVISEAAHEQAA